MARTVLFSDKQLAQYINNNFEACWQPLRPVPTLTVDFGGGRVLKRTLHGNIATYICQADGQVIDILPGLYAPRTYQANLRTLLSVVSSVAKASDRTAALVAYHTGKTQFPLYQSTDIAEPETFALAGAKFADSIRQDIIVNETEKRPVIHEMLAHRTITKPHDVTNEVYKRTLGLDLEDPYLGLGETLSCKFPGE
jgi:hypothetical protein